MPFPVAAIAALGAGAMGMGGQLYDTYQSVRTSKRNVDRTIAAQKAEAELAYQRSVEMWHKQNAYNSPEEQMKRFGSAGLNPHLIYGQGNAGNASAVAPYQAANLQYRYEAPQYGGAIGALLPTLMSVGSWMQNMRLTETEIESKRTGMDRTRQLIEYLRERNPAELRKLGNQLSIFPYQESAARNVAERGNLQLTDMLEKLRYDWGYEFEGLEYGDYSYKEAGRGRRAQELRKLEEDTRLRKSQADWFEPATIMRLVLGSVLGLSRMGSRVQPRSGGSVRMVGKGSLGRWSANRKRWIPSR